MANGIALAIHVCLLLIQLLVSAAPPFPHKNYFHITCISLLVFASHIVGPVSSDAAETQPYTLLWPIWLGTIEKCMTAGQDAVENHYWRPARQLREATHMLSFGRNKFAWAAKLLANWRLVGWNHQAKNVPPPRYEAKSVFLFDHILEFSKLLLMSDLVLQLNIRLFWTGEDGSTFLDSKHLTIRDEAWLLSFIKVMAFGCGPYFFMHMQYVAASVITVLLGLSEPCDWPPLFGNITEATTVRAFWGVFWHQSIRRPLTTISNAVLDALKIQQKSTFRSYAFLYVAFALSGILHAQSMALLPRPSNITLAESTLGVMSFFVWQAFAITIEDYVQWLWRRTGRTLETLGNCRHWLGYLWVMGSMWFSLPWAADVMMRLRLTEKSFLPFTIFGSLLAQQAFKSL